MVRPLDENHGTTPLQGHGSWLMCEGARSVVASDAKAGAKTCHIADTSLEEDKILKTRFHGTHASTPN